MPNAGDEINMKIGKGTKVMIDVGVNAKNDISAEVLSIPSVIEEDMGYGTMLVRIPMHQSRPLLSPNSKLFIRISANHKVYGAPIKLVSQIKHGELVLAKIQLLKRLRSRQTRGFYRMSCDMPITIEHTNKRNEQELFAGTALNISMGGMLFLSDKFLRTNEQIIMYFNIGTIEMVKAEALNVEKTESGKYKIAIKFIDSSDAQQNKIHQYIFDKQLEGRRSLYKKKPLHIVNTDNQKDRI